MVGQRAPLVNQINRICDDDGKQREECLWRLDQAPIQQLILFVRNVRKNCAARFYESIKIVNVRRMRRDSDSGRAPTEELPTRHQQRTL